MSDETITTAPLSEKPELEKPLLHPNGHIGSGSPQALAAGHIGSGVPPADGPTADGLTADGPTAVGTDEPDGGDGGTSTSPDGHIGSGTPPTDPVAPVPANG